MIEGVTRAKGLVSLARELGPGELSNVVQLGADSSAARSFVSHRVWGEDEADGNHDVWLQKSGRGLLGCRS